MILAIDIGNTTVGVYAVCKKTDTIDIMFSFKLPTDASWSAAMYAKALKQELGKYALPSGEGSENDKQMMPQTETFELDFVAISSVVPVVSEAVKAAVEIAFHIEAVELSNQDNRLLQLQVSQPQKVGFDRIADATWAAMNYPLPVVTVDMGTATTFNVIDEQRNFLGGAIAPGILTGVEALSQKAAKLPAIPIEAPAHMIGRDTVECMQSGAVIGAAAMVDGMIDRFEAELGRTVTVVMTGGGAELVHPFCHHVHVYEPYLLIKGLVLLAEPDIS